MIEVTGLSISLLGFLGYVSNVLQGYGSLFVLIIGLNNFSFGQTLG